MTYSQGSKLYACVILGGPTGWYQSGILAKKNLIERLHVSQTEQPVKEAGLTKLVKISTRRLCRGDVL